MNQGEDGKVDLSSVNKTQKVRTFPKLKIKNPFKKQAGPVRDTEGKFASGSGGLLGRSKFNFKRAIPLVIVVALVGGFFVFRSFAAVTQPPAYQYSITTCGGSSREAGSEKNAACREQSAEALVYRMQSALFGRQPDWGYKNWTQRLAGDRATQIRVAQEMEATSEVRWGSLTNRQFVEKMAQAAFGGLAKPAQITQWTKDLDSKKISRVQLAKNSAAIMKTSEARVLGATYKYNNQQFVEQIFKKLLKRGDAYVAPANDYWVNQLNTGKMSRAEVALRIARTSEAITKSRTDIQTYVASKPKVKIVQTAKNKQVAREREINQLISSAKTHYERGALYHQKQASGLVGQARTQAQPNAPSRAALTTIGNLQKQAETNLGHAKESANNAGNDQKKAEELLKQAKAVTKYSPDIPSSAIEQGRNKVIVYAAGARNKVNEINAYIGQISSSYKVAEGKYQAEQQRIAEQQRRAAEAARNRNQSTGNGNSGSGSAPSPAPTQGGTGAATERRPKYSGPRSISCSQVSTYSSAMRSWIYNRHDPKTHGNYWSCHAVQDYASSAYPRVFTCNAGYHVYSHASNNGWFGKLCLSDDYERP